MPLEIWVNLFSNMSRMHRAVFLDRDGVINKERLDYVKALHELEMISEIIQPIKMLKENGFLIVIITNQSAINRGLTSHNIVKEIHNYIQDYFRENGITIDGFYYCPHRPDENCDCRKPKPGLILMASDALNIDLSSSWMIGDNDSDVKAATSAGCKAIKISTDFKLSDAVQDILNSKDFDRVK